MVENNKIVQEILDLKNEKGISILAHNYQLPEIQDIADFTGDSLGLAQRAVNISQKTVLMCGVYFMAETVSILNPDKTVFIPDRDAGCPLSNFAPIEMVLNWRNKYPEHDFVAYVNTSAVVKSVVDICCTSSNAVKIVKSLDNKKIVFLPDKNLGHYVKELVPEKEIVLWPGFCVVHEMIDPETIVDIKKKYPNALVMAHPECRKEILDMSDGICSTGQMIGFVENNPGQKQFIVVTEWGMAHALRKKFPARQFIEPEKRLECKNMKKNTLEKIRDVLKSENIENRVVVEPEIAEKARISIEKMLKFS